MCTEKQNAVAPSIDQTDQIPLLTAVKVSLPLCCTTVKPVEHKLKDASVECTNVPQSICRNIRVKQIG